MKEVRPFVQLLKQALKNHKLWMMSTAAEWSTLTTTKLLGDHDVRIDYRQEQRYGAVHYPELCRVLVQQNIRTTNITLTSAERTSLCRSLLRFVTRYKQKEQETLAKREARKIVKLEQALQEYRPHVPLPHGLIL